MEIWDYRAVHPAIRRGCRVLYVRLMLHLWTKSFGRYSSAKSIDMDLEALIYGRLLDAYLSTEFWVEEVPDPFLLRVGSCSPALRALHEECGATCSAFLTAYNPDSHPQSEEVNRGAQDRIEAELAQGGFALRRGMGRDPSGAWPGEPSVLALGIQRDEAEHIGRRYGQNAIVWSGADAVPQLLVLVRGD